MPSTIRVALIGDYDQAITAHRAIPLALDLAAASVGSECAQLLPQERHALSA